MADKSQRLPINVPGRFYVDSTCICTEACAVTAPKNFKKDEASGYYFVYKQPETEEELNQCLDAVAGCPVEAIGDDGDE